VQAHFSVIPGLDPGIHAVRRRIDGSEAGAKRRCVDARVKPGHDGVLW
jgi:hypothetical protein